MSERASIRGSRGGGGRGGPSERGSRGGRGGHGDGASERPKKENILDLSRYADKALLVKFSGGREVRGVLKGWDQLMNLVLDEVVETFPGRERELGLLVARGTLLTSISPADGSEEIANPFAAPEEEE